MSGRSYTKIYIHAVWHIKLGSVTIKPEHTEHLYANIACSLNQIGCSTVVVNGTANHVHVLFVLSKNISVSDAIARVKRTTSSWLKNVERYYADFAWQSGYAAFSVSQSVVPSTIEYIKNQETHHQKVSFEEEFRKFLDLYGITYDEKYVYSYE